MKIKASKNAPNTTVRSSSGVPSIAVIMHFKGMRYRRSMIEKFRPSDSEMVVIEQDVPSVELSGGAGGAFAGFLSAIRG